MRSLLVRALILAPLLFSNTAAAASTTVVISEFRTRGPNGANDEFIELFNVSSSPVVLSGFHIVVSDASGTTTVLKQLGAVTIPPRRFYLLTNNGVQGYSGTVNPNATYTVAIPDNGGIALQNLSGTTIDAVGMSTGSAFKEGTPLAPTTNNVNQSYERNGGGCSPSRDTDDNFTDFRLNATRSFPQNSGTVCNPCQGVQCLAPPNAQCWLPSGVCSQGSCTYTQRPSGASCSDGDACTTGDTCDVAGACESGPPEPCTTPPPAFCSDPQTSVTFAAQGTCSLPTGCSYVENAPTTCQFGCNGTTGECQPDPCTGKLCDTPPPTGCYLPAGQCVSGTCVYTTMPAATPCNDRNGCTIGDTCNANGKCVAGPRVSVDDGNVCTQDLCAPLTGVITHRAVPNGADCDDGDACNGLATCRTGQCQNGAPVTCDAPPLGGCHEDTGVCNPANGACSYAFKLEGEICSDASACTTGDQCDGNGACNGSTLVCVTPAPTCADANTSRTFSGGLCSPTTGDCSFTGTDVTCAFGCNGASGLCDQDPCIGVVCDGPPSTCHVDQGVCAGGVCSYSLKPAGATCNDGNACTTVDECSAGGACTGTPLLCNLPPLPGCVGANTSRTFDANGVCSAGACDYPVTDTACPLGCVALTGLCQGDPCIGITCDEPPSQCHQAVGACSGGVCSYTLKPAASSCDDGDACTEADVCSPSGACAGTSLTCNSPPPVECTGPATSRSYDTVGTCSPIVGGCAYASADTTCANGCDVPSGRCVGDPCVGVVCETAPGSCFVSTGSCAAGQCTYPPRLGGVPCDDGVLCTIADACDGAGVCSGAQDPQCGDGGVPDGGAGGADGSVVPDGGSGGSGGSGVGGTGPDGGIGGSGVGGTGPDGGVGGTGVGGVGPDGGSGGSGVGGTGPDGGVGGVGPDGGSGGTGVGGTGPDGGVGGTGVGGVSPDGGVGGTGVGGTGPDGGVGGAGVGGASGGNTGVGGASSGGGAGATGAGGRGVAGSVAGTSGGKPGTSGSPEDAGVDRATGAKVEGGGCGCSLPRSSSHAGWSLALLAVGLLGARRRRRGGSSGSTR